MQTFAELIWNYPHTIVLWLPVWGGKAPLILPPVLPPLQGSGHDWGAGSKRVASFPLDRLPATVAMDLL